MDFEINLIFLIKLFFQQDQKVITKTYKYLENEKSFQDEIKSIIHHFKGLSNEANNRIFSGRWKSNFNAFVNKYILSRESQSRRIWRVWRFRARAITWRIYIRKRRRQKKSDAQNQEGQGLKILTPDQMLTRLQITLAQLQTGNNSKKLEIRQVLYSLYRSKN